MAQSPDRTSAAAVPRQLWQACPGKGALGNPLEYFYLLLNIVLAAKRSTLQLASHRGAAGSLQLLGSSSAEITVLEQWLDSCNGLGCSGTEQEVTYGFRKGQAHLSVAGLRSSLEFLRGEILK